LVFASSLTSVAGLIVDYNIRANDGDRPREWKWRMWNLSTSLGRAGKWLGWALVWLIVGMGADDIWRYHHTYVLSNLSVIAVPGDTVMENKKPRVLAVREYWLQRHDEPVGQGFPFNFCEDYDPKPYRGAYIEVIVYEVKFNAQPPCRSVGGGGKNGIILY
jgi:hypothetical protein